MPASSGEKDEAEGTSDILPVCSQDGSEGETSHAEVVEETAVGGGNPCSQSDLLFLVQQVTNSPVHKLMCGSQ